MASTRAAAGRRPAELDKKKPAAVTAETDLPNGKGKGSGITVPYDVDELDQELIPSGVYLEGEPIPDGRVELFHLEEKVYTAPRHLPPNMPFKFMRKMRNTDADLASFWLIEQYLGEHVVDVLADHDELTDDELDAILKVVRKHTMATLEKATGK